MISIIICSRTSMLDSQLAANIADTIGVPHEFIVIDSDENKLGICQAYNKGVALSRYEILCFMHDDISYHTQNWGQKVKAHFADSHTGAIGVAGSPYCSFMPGPWWGHGLLYENILQGNQVTGEIALKSNHGNTPSRRSVVLDGVWLCIKKDLFNKISFDEITFPEFHFYDLDICMQIYQTKQQVYCVNDILIAHASLGNVNGSWLKAALKFQEKWRMMLPVSSIPLSNTQARKLDYKTINSFILACAANGYDNKHIYKLALTYLLKFKPGYLFYKTPGYLAKFLFKYLFKKGAPFYNLS